jgi:parallel beta-helix repeat protein
MGYPPSCSGFYLIKKIIRIPELLSSFINIHSWARKIKGIKMNRRKLVGLSLSSIIVLLLGLSVNFFQESHETNEIAISASVTSVTAVTLSPESEIVITSDTQLSNNASSGTGTSGDPYILGGWNITASGNFKHGISISGTTKYFVIRNNYINTGGLIDVHGIFINGVANGTARIENNTVENNDVGIKIQSGTYSVIRNNSVVSSGKYGIETNDGAKNTTVVDNILRNNYDGGIRIESSGSKVINNTIYGDPGEFSPSADTGIIVDRNDVVVSNNKVFGASGQGIGMSPTSNVQIVDNLVQDCWVGIAGWFQNSSIINNSLVKGSFGSNGINFGDPTSFGMNNTNNIITGNLLMNYPGYAIFIDVLTFNNSIYNNAFINNNFDNPGSPQARDFNNNKWFNSTTNIGNYWHDYSGSGSYTLVGGAMDQYPLPFFDFDQDLMADGWEYDNNLNPTDATDATGDLDADSLSNVYEYQNGLNANNKDTDGDQMPDGFEVNSGLDPLNKSDADLDLDGDKMPNGWEYQHGFNLTRDDSQEDADDDSLTNVDEYTEGTNPLDNDTDSDGLIDGIEVHTTFTNPTNSDSDGDGLSDGEEINIYSTDPNDDDSDDDGASDGDEVAAGTDPNDKDVFPTTTTTTTTSNQTSSWSAILLILSLLAVGLHQKRKS